MRNRLACGIDAVTATLRFGGKLAIAYRASLLVWILTTSFPLASLAMWWELSSEAAVGGFSQNDFVTYFVVTFLVRQATATWVVWELESSIRDGRFALLLLRPISPIVYLALINIAGLPVRLILALPLGLLVLAVSPGIGLPTSLWHCVCIFFAIALAWLINFLSQVLIGTLAFWWTRASSMYEVWIALYVVSSGYIVPLALLPEGVQTASRLLPFYASMGAVVELFMAPANALPLATVFGTQLAWIFALVAVLSLAWTRGLRQFSAVGT